MKGTLRKLLVATLLITAAPALALLAYDVIAVVPELDRVEQLLALASPQDANPPQIIRRLIDADAGSPATYATQRVTAELYPDGRQGERHLRNALWRVLLPLHLGTKRIYGLYATLAYNGTDYGLNSFALREYGHPLDQLSNAQAAGVVAMTHAPALYLRDRSRLDQRASWLLEKAQGATADAR